MKSRCVPSAGVGSWVSASEPPDGGAAEGDERSQDDAVAHHAQQLGRQHRYMTGAASRAPYPSRRGQIDANSHVATAAALAGFPGQKPPQEQQQGPHHGCRYEGALTGRQERNTGVNELPPSPVRLSGPTVLAGRR